MFPCLFLAVAFLNEFEGAPSILSRLFPPVMTERRRELSIPESRGSGRKRKKLPEDSGYEVGN